MAAADVTADFPLSGVALSDRAVWVSRARRMALPAAGLAAVAVAVVVLGGPLQTFADALRRAVSADVKWVVAGAAFEVISFTGYVLLFWHVAGRATPRIGMRESYQVTLAGAAATRLLPTGGAGGVAMTLWALRSTGLGTAGATRALLGFLVVLYSVFLGAIAVAGLAMAGDGPVALTIAPAAFALAAIAGALALGLRRRPTDEVPAGRLARPRRAARTVGDGVRDAFAILRAGDLRLLGAPVWWIFDVAVMWSAFQALGTPPALGIVVIGYFVGQLANTLPIPGAVSGGMVGVLLAFRVPADLAIASVLTYRAMALWFPAPFGAAAIVGLRRTVARWSADAPVIAEPDVAPGLVVLPPAPEAPAPRRIALPATRGRAAGVPIAA